MLTASLLIVRLLCRDHRSSNGDDKLEEGGLRASSSFSHEIKEHDNDKAIDNLQDRVAFLKRLTGDIHDEVESHNHLLDRMGNGMDATRGMIVRHHGLVQEEWAVVGFDTNDMDLGRTIPQKLAIEVGETKALYISSIEVA
ncbi:hypothetical protein REPUB_Repub15cG0048600 [Reevesia pubescens]